MKFYIKPFLAMGSYNMAFRFRNGHPDLASEDTDMRDIRRSSRK